MVFVHRPTGRIVDVPARPGPAWDEVPGHGALFRRRERAGWKAAHAYAPDATLWSARGWERVRFRDAEEPAEALRGARSGLLFAFAPAHPNERPPLKPGHVWLVLPDEPALDSPAARPGAQAPFGRDDLEAGAVGAAALAAGLFGARIVAAGLPLDKALWVLTGPPVSPQDARMVHRLRGVLDLAARLADDVAEAAKTLPAAPPRETREQTRQRLAERSAGKKRVAASRPGAGGARPERGSFRERGRPAGKGGKPFRGKKGATARPQRDRPPKRS